MNHESCIVKNNGVTLIELMVVVAIIGIIMGIASLSMVDMSRTAKLNEARDMLLADIQDIKLKSIAGVPHGIIIVSGASYQVVKLNDTNNNFKRDLTPLPAETYTSLSSTVTLPSGMTITAPAVGTEVWFDRKGIPKTSNWQFSNPSFTLTKGGETRTITISRTGRVKYEQ